MLLPVLLALLLAAASLVFSLQNASPSTVSFLVWRFESSQAVLLLASYAAGLLTGILLILPARVRAGLRSRSRKGQVEELERELADAKRLAEIEAAQPSGPKPAA